MFVICEQTATTTERTDQKSKRGDDGGPSKTGELCPAWLLRAATNAAVRWRWPIQARRQLLHEWRPTIQPRSRPTQAYTVLQNSLAILDSLSQTRFIETHNMTIGVYVHGRGTRSPQQTQLGADPVSVTAK